MRCSATRDGFRITYTQPLSEQTAGAVATDPATAFRLRQWRYAATEQYGGPKVDEQQLTVAAARVSRDRTTVDLVVPGLSAGRVVHLRSPRPFAAQSGAPLLSTEAWYTLNAKPGPSPAPVFHEAEQGRRQGGAGVGSDHRGFSGIGFVDGFGNQGASTTMHIEVDRPGRYELGLRYANGPNPFVGDKSVSLHVNGQKIGRTVLPSTGGWADWSTKAETVALRRGVNTVEYRVDPGDTGHVNLDLVAVREPRKRIMLFDGSSTEAWRHTDGRVASWPLVGDRAMQVGGGDLRTAEAFGDFRAHVEWKTPVFGPEVTGQDRGNAVQFRDVWVQPLG